MSFLRRILPVAKSSRGLAGILPAHEAPLGIFLARMIHDGTKESTHKENNVKKSRETHGSTNHRTATEIVWPASMRQRKYGSRVHRALMQVLMEDVRLKNDLVLKHGLSIEEVRISPDLMTAYILWESCTDDGEELESELRRSRASLRSALARKLATRNVPRLEYRRNTLSQEERQLEDLLQGARRNNHEEP